jgi:hypothetical protein
MSTRHLDDLRAQAQTCSRVGEHLALPADGPPLRGLQGPGPPRSEPRRQVSYSPRAPQAAHSETEGTGDMLVE